MQLQETRRLLKPAVSSLHFRPQVLQIWPVYDTARYYKGDIAFPVAAVRLWNSLSLHVTAVPPLSPSSAVVLNHISSHFLIPLSDSSLSCTVPAQ